MASKTEIKVNRLHFPVMAMIVMAILSAVVVGGSFEVIKYWPQPQSVDPVCDWLTGGIWGFVAGGFFGFVLGFLTDDSHFPRDLHDTPALPGDAASR
ncbi:MAG: hypothetical protein SGJ27_16735 [Candidatus Melainabacteria bacterium]|nr:hypothetical protein [Candidatus Melainabacteria bacterium]